MQTWGWWSLPCFALYPLLVLCLMLSWLLLSCSFWRLLFAAIWSKDWSMSNEVPKTAWGVILAYRHPSKPCLVQRTVLNCNVFYCMILEVMRLLNIFNIIFKYWWSNEKIVKHQSLHGLHKIRRHSFIFSVSICFSVMVSLFGRKLKAWREGIPSSQWKHCPHFFIFLFCNQIAL